MSKSVKKTVMLSLSKHPYRASNSFTIAVEMLRLRSAWRSNGSLSTQLNLFFAE
jgi:hypothetical protein